MKTFVRLAVALLAITAVCQASLALAEDYYRVSGSGQSASLTGQEKAAGAGAIGLQFLQPGVLLPRAELRGVRVELRLRHGLRRVPAVGHRRLCRVRCVQGHQRRRRAPRQFRPRDRLERRRADTRVCATTASAGKSA